MNTKYFLLILLLYLSGSCAKQVEKENDFNSNSKKFAVIFSHYYNCKAFIVKTIEEEKIDTIFKRVCNMQHSSFEDYYLLFENMKMPLKMIAGGCPNEIKDIVPAKTLEIFVDSSFSDYDSIKTNLYPSVSSNEFGNIIAALFKDNHVSGFSDIVFEIKNSKNSNSNCLQKILLLINKAYIKYLLESNCLNNLKCNEKDIELFFNENKLQIILSPMSNKNKEYCEKCM